MSELLNNVYKVFYPKIYKRTLLVESVSKNNFLFLKEMGVANVAELYTSEASLLLREELNNKND